MGQGAVRQVTVTNLGQQTFGFYAVDAARGPEPTLHSFMLEEGCAPHIGRSTRFTAALKAVTSGTILASQTRPGISSISPVASASTNAGLDPCYCTDRS